MRNRTVALDSLTFLVPGGGDDPLAGQLDNETLSRLLEDLELEL